MTAILVLAVRLIGLIWAIGALVIVRNALAMGRSADARWVLVGGALTFVAGILLLLASPWAVVAAVAVAVQQAFLHRRQTRRLGPGAPRPRPARVWVALGVAAAGLLAARLGGLS